MFQLVAGTETRFEVSEGKTHHSDTLLMKIRVGSADFCGQFRRIRTAPRRPVSVSNKFIETSAVPSKSQCAIGFVLFCKRYKLSRIIPKLKSLFVALILSPCLMSPLQRAVTQYYLKGLFWTSPPHHAHIFRLLGYHAERDIECTRQFYSGQEVIHEIKYWHPFVCQSIDLPCASSHLKQHSSAHKTVYCR